jgi:hypothetical protein
MPPKPKPTPFIVDTTSNQPLPDPWHGTQPTDYTRINGKGPH